MARSGGGRPTDRSQRQRAASAGAGGSPDDLQQAGRPSTASPGETIAPAGAMVAIGPRARGRKPFSVVHQRRCPHRPTRTRAEIIRLDGWPPNGPSAHARTGGNSVIRDHIIFSGPQHAVGPRGESRFHAHYISSKFARLPAGSRPGSGSTSTPTIPAPFSTLLDASHANGPMGLRNANQKAVQPAPTRPSGAESRFVPNRLPAGPTIGTETASRQGEPEVL